MKSNSFCFLRNIAVSITNESHYLDFFLIHMPSQSLIKITFLPSCNYISSLLCFSSWAGQSDHSNNKQQQSITEGQNQNPP